jgi:RNA polymerase sigma-70 factor (ECF subfamily)
MDRTSVDRNRTLAEIEALYRRRFNEFLRVATATVGSRELGRDAVQEAFVTAIRHCHQYRGDGPIEAWLWRIVVTSALKARRTASTQEPTAPSVAAASSNGTAEHAFDEVRLAVGRLPERQRTILFLRYYADLDYETIASVLNVRPGTVAAGLNAAHRAVRRRIQEVAVRD